MTSLRYALLRASARVGIVFGALLGTLMGPSASAASFSDPYGTSDVLQGRTERLRDPLGRDCSASGGALTFFTAVEVALCRNPATRSAWAAARQQAAALGMAESAWAPSLTLTGSESRTFGGVHVDPAGNYISTPQDAGDAALNLTWTLYDFGARSGRITSARKLLDAAAGSANSAAQQTVLAVVQAYYGLVAAEASLAAAKRAEAAYQRGLEVARGRREGGAATVADVLQAETALDGAVIARMQAEGTLKAARGTLAVTIGSRADEPFMLDPDAVPTDVPPLRARVNELIDAAGWQRPDLAAARAQRDAAEANVAVARAAGWPTISLGAGRSVVDNTGLPHQGYNTIGINISVPIFSGFNTAYGVRQAEAALEASEANVEQVRLNVSRDVWAGYYALDTANQELTATAALLKSAEDSEQVALGRYQSGVGTILDLLTAQAAAVTAHQQRISVEYGWQLARAQLVFALGVLYGSEPLSKRATVP